MRLLIIEDEKDIALPLKKSLEKKGFAVDFADNGREGLSLAQVNEYDCVLLDLNLPEIDGITLAKRLRGEENATPIIMLTARSQVYNKLKGFDVGADDYVTKPFNLEELIARIKVVIKRSSTNQDSRLKIQDLELHPEKNIVVESTGKEIELSTKETGILEYLIRNKGKIVSTEELLEHVWDSEIDTFTTTVKTHIKTLRKKIDPQKTVIRTIRNKGYVIN